MKTMIISLFLLTAHLVHGQNIEKSLALNEAGSAIVKLMQLTPEFNTRQNFDLALHYLKQAEAEDPENKSVIHNLGMLYYNWAVSLARQSKDSSDDQFDVIHNEMVQCGERADYYLQKHAAVSAAAPSPASED